MFCFVFKCSCLQSSQRPPGGSEVLHFWTKELEKLQETMQVRDFLLFFPKGCIQLRDSMIWVQQPIEPPSLGVKNRPSLLPQTKRNTLKNRERKPDSGHSVDSGCWRPPGQPSHDPGSNFRKFTLGPDFNNCTQPLKEMSVLPCNQITWESSLRAGDWAAWVKKEPVSPLSVRFQVSLEFMGPPELSRQSGRW